MKISKELDIRHIVKELRTVKFIQKVLLTKYQRIMIPYFKGNLLNEVVSSQDNSRKNVKDDKLADFLKQALMSTRQNVFDKRLIKSIELTKQEQQQLQEVFNSNAIDIKRTKKSKKIRRKNNSQSEQKEIRNQYKDSENNIDQDEFDSEYKSHRGQKKIIQKDSCATEQHDICIPNIKPLSNSDKRAFDLRIQSQPKYLQNI
ncbi:UNKNOWN [Stylonychia lemnae]|uniref:Uncharacterized protein n=1 Tax=Stylonychia lemnae TaxID=5949 RepID=A0A078AZU7_STYLE|nr:UNKNOWN [Stylonychia lemnae]|eukprot:CDW86712.1 UNKNOWN [Stylonychia lemnae]